MPRTLPWLTGGGSNGRASKDSTPQRSKIKTPKPEPKIGPRPEDDETPKGTAEDPSKKRDIFRSSQSPPTSPIQRCPSEEYLLEGFDKDDIYMMVEDEFYAVAQTFTQHLHYAEYVRRKKEAKLQNAAAIQDIARPTDGVTPMSEEALRKKTADAVSERQKTGLDQIERSRPRVDSEEENDDELDDAEVDSSFAGTSLYGLMMSPRKARSLMGMQGIKSTTRAAAGYAQTSEFGGDRRSLFSSPNDRQEKQHRDVDETASEDDDLDIETNTAPLRRADRTPATTNTNSATSRATSRGGSNISQSMADRKAKETMSMSAKYRTQSGSTSKRRMLFDDFDRLPEPNKSNISMQRGNSTSISKTSQKGSHSKGPDSKKSRLNEVPTFLL
ncbi:hypothetical protein ASPWEDRAFT_39157 [Aspergillus wentii DTO 134E9]|uniref:Uncharacterized protein n=1 Tax=Aspergillus wentii DTO 134E9 TaxID=1073089 RepID=A0A1L9RRJ0_ASPWE|nr:uncharacterized protein ASPWEDRAFT_39157 [Aspergillus wentii DTO 134E9]KAI9930318.1 hypothetical protein MW887_011070 [Aspergillus wentii]OJJ37468.1 hypothetical protein ASPWEDRAFT_39157 [Aspergillus wentii DTO 134E9]